jgi:hypothetical protein
MIFTFHHAQQTLWKRGPERDGGGTQFSLVKRQQPAGFDKADHADDHGSVLHRLEDRTISFPALQQITLITKLTGQQVDQVSGR